MAIITVQNLSKSFKKNRIPAIDDVSLTVNNGEILTILGPSGCGKTTVLRIIAGFETPTKGNVILNNVKLTSNDVFITPEKRNIGFVFQEFALFPHLTVKENIEFGLSGSDSNSINKRVKKLVKLVGLLGFETYYPSELSGGQQQRVALARALAPQPLVILFDEPFGSLDSSLRNKMRVELKKILKVLQITTIFVTHDQKEAFLISDKIAIMQDGIIHQIGTPNEIYHKPQNRFVAEFVGYADFVNGFYKDGVIFTELGEFGISGKKISTFPLLGKNMVNDDKITVMFRPDDIDIVPAEFGNGIITSLDFTGDKILYTIKLRSGKFVHSSQPSSFYLVKDTSVLIIPNPNHLVVLKGDDVVYQHEDIKELLNKSL